MTTWRRELTTAFAEHGESWDDVVGVAIAEGGLDKEFYAGFGAEEGQPFTAWTSRRVYFPWHYDGAEGVASVPRDPCDEVTEHVGGG